MPKVNEECLATSVIPSAGSIKDDGEMKEHCTMASRKFCNMEEFFVSIKKDAEAAMALAERLKTDVVKKFVNIIESCEGTLITSGIGKSD